MADIDIMNSQKMTETFQKNIANVLNGLQYPIIGHRWDNKDRILTIITDDEEYNSDEFGVTSLTFHILNGCIDFLEFQGESSYEYWNK